MKKILFTLVTLLITGLAIAQQATDNPNKVTNFNVKVFHDEKNIVNEHFAQIRNKDSYKTEINLDPTLDYLSLEEDENGNHLWKNSDIPGLSIKLKMIDGKFEINTYNVNRKDKAEYVQVGESKILDYNEKFLLPSKYKNKDLFIEIKSLKEIIFN